MQGTLVCVWTLILSISLLVGFVLLVWVQCSVSCYLDKKWQIYQKTSFINRLPWLRAAQLGTQQPQERRTCSCPICKKSNLKSLRTKISWWPIKQRSHSSTTHWFISRTNQINNKWIRKLQQRRKWVICSSLLAGPRRRGRQWGKVEVKEGSQFDSREQHQSVWELNFIMEEHTGRAKCHDTQCRTARWEIDTSVSAHCYYFIEKLSCGMPLRETLTVPDIVYASWTFSEALGTDFVSTYLCNTSVPQMFVLQNNKSDVKPQEYPFTHPPAIPPRVTGSATTGWETRTQPSVHVFGLFFFLLHECLGLMDYTTVVQSSLHCTCIQWCLCECVYCTDCIAPWTWIKHCIVKSSLLHSCSTQK